MSTYTAIERVARAVRAATLGVDVEDLDRGIGPSTEDTRAARVFLAMLDAADEEKTPDVPHLRGYTSEEVRDLCTVAWDEGCRAGWAGALTVDDDANPPNPYRTADRVATVVEQLEVTQRQLAAAEMREQSEVRQRRAIQAELQRLREQLAADPNAKAVEELTADNSRLRAELEALESEDYAKALETMTEENTTLRHRLRTIDQDYQTTIQARSDENAQLRAKLVRVGRALEWQTGGVS